MFDLSNKLILVTGASSGIGRATAIVLSQRGAKVILCSRREAELRTTQEMMTSPEQHEIAAMDLTDTDAIPNWVQQICKRGDRQLGGLVHAAGIGTTVPLRVLNRRRIDEVMTVNTYAALGLLRAAAVKGVPRAEGCSVVLISSIAGLIGMSGLTAYGASKGALHAIVKSAALELAARRIRVNCIAPAWVDTPMLQEAVTGLPGGLSHVDARQPLGLIPPAEVGAAAAFLLSNEARHITGTTLVIDGGYTC